MKSKVELTWNEVENSGRKEPRIRFEFAMNSQEEGSSLRCYESSMHVCPQPRCHCTEVRLQLKSADSTQLTSSSLNEQWMWINIFQQTLSPISENENNLEYEYLTELFERDWNRSENGKLAQWLSEKKMEIIETTSPSEIDITHLTDPSDGKMVGFSEIFPLALSLKFEREGERWIVDEQYCVQPDCQCEQVGLHFFKIPKFGDTKIFGKRAPFIRYNYHTQFVEIIHSGMGKSPLIHDLIPTLRKSYPDLDDQLKRRHMIMQSLYFRYYEQQRLSETLSESTPILNVTKSPKVGRNDRCPCGSGRKYKHCCLNK